MCPKMLCSFMEYSNMRKKVLNIVLVLLFTTLTGCEYDEEISTNMETTTKEIDLIENELNIVLGNTSANINYSNDKTANAFIERYNELNPDDIITEERVICPNNGGIYLTIIEFEYMDFCISESDGSPSFRCESVLEYNDENTKGFFNEAFYVIQAVENNLSDEDIKQIITNLQNGEYPFATNASVDSSSRKFSFTAPSSFRKRSKGKDIKLTYELYWSHASLY